MTPSSIYIYRFTIRAKTQLLGTSTQVPYTVPVFFVVRCVLGVPRLVLVVVLTRRLRRPRTMEVSPTLTPRG